MARKNRNLAGFNEVANNNFNKNINKDDNANVNVDVNEEQNINVEDTIKVNTNADNNIKEDLNEDIHINENNKVSKKENDTPAGDYLDKLIEGKAKKSESDKELTGIYLEKDLLQILDRLAKKGGRGAKSRIVNEALRSVFIEKGLL